MDQNKKKIKLKSVCQIPDFPECHIQLSLWNIFDIPLDHK